MFRYSSPEETPLKMDGLLSWYRNAALEHHPIIVAAKLHYDFVLIHPFDDGNGRVSRLLMNYHLLRHGFPPVIIKSEDKKNYLAALNRADTGDFEAFARYIAEQMLWSLQLNILSAKGESIEEEGDWEKELAVWERSISNDVPQVKELSNDLAFERINDSIILFFNQLNDKTLQFDKFFDKASKTISCRLSDGHFQESTLENLAQLITDFHSLDRLKSIQQIDLNFRWYGFFQNPAPVNDVSIWIKIEFERYKYKIELYTTQGTTFNWNLTIPISSQERGKMVETIGKYMVEKIKSLV
jgi:hypothetical protein